MRRINLDLFELQAFLRVAEHGSFRMAAEDVGLTGSALSRLIIRIEEKLEARLFDRDTRNVHLTPQGRHLLRISERILGETEAALDEFAGFLAARRGHLTLAGLPSVTAGLLPQIVSRFVADRPDVDVRIFDALSDGVISALLEGRADLGFTAGAVAATERLAFRPLFDEPVMAVAWPGGPLDDREACSWAELVELPFVAMAPGTSVRALTEAALAQAGLSLRPRFEVSHLATAGALVAEGLGVTALPTLTLPVLSSSPLTVRPLVEPSVQRRIGFAYLAGRTPSPAASAFRDLILSTNFRAGTKYGQAGLR